MGNLGSPDQIQAVSYQLPGWTGRLVSYGKLELLTVKQKCGHEALGCLCGPVGKKDIFLSLRNHF